MYCINQLIYIKSIGLKLNRYYDRVKLERLRKHSINLWKEVQLRK